MFVNDSRITFMKAARLQIHLIAIVIRRTLLSV